MNRVRAMMATTAALLVAGCGGMQDYESRLNATVTGMKEEQKLKTYTEDPAQGKVKDLNVYLRPPKPAAEESSLQLSQAPGMFDFGTTYAVSAKAPPAKEGAPAPALPPMKMHVLIRQKAKKAAAKKGEAAPDPAAAAPTNRGDFTADVRAILAADFGGDVAEKSPTNVTVGKTPFKQFKFAATSGASNGDTIQAYLADANKGELQVALVFDIPPSIQNNTIVTDGKDLCLKHFALGNKARTAFTGKAAKTGGAAAGPAF